MRFEGQLFVCERGAAAPPGPIQDDGRGPYDSEEGDEPLRWLTDSSEGEERGSGTEARPPARPDSRRPACRLCRPLDSLRRTSPPLGAATLEL